MAGIALGAGGDAFGSAFKDDLTAASAAFGAKVNQPVGVFYHIKVVFNDDHGVVVFHQAPDDGQQFFNVGHVQAGRGLVHNIDVAFFVELGSKLDPLGFAARKRA